MTSERLDRRVRTLHPELSWARIRTAIARGQVTVDGVPARDPGLDVMAAATVDFDASRPALATARIDLPRLYEDDEILVIDKPAGLLTIASSPEGRASEDTVLRRVQEYARRLHGRNGYAGVLHRLDRDTSGALAVALTREAHRAGRALFAAHAFERWYLALVEGVPAEAAGTIAAPISNEYVAGRRRIVGAGAGRPAVTHYRVREAWRRAALLELELETGRQHQIRLHLQQLGHPVVGEGVYVADERAPARRRVKRQMLHAWRLAFPHPVRARTVRAESPVPPDFEQVLAQLRRAAAPRA